MRDGRLKASRLPRKIDSASSTQISVSPMKVSVASVIE